MKINVNYHSSILVDDRIYFDPLKVDGEVKAKYIFITHPHCDHFSPEDIKKIVDNDTKFVCPESMKEEYCKNFKNDAMFVVPEKTYKLDDIGFETFSSYNLNKSFHPKENNWVGYIVNIHGQRVAVVGDSDDTPDLRKIKTDILLIPIGGHYTMTLSEAANATNAIKPKKVIPTHYGEVVGNENMGEEFKLLLDKNIECELQI